MRYENEFGARIKRHSFFVRKIPLVGDLSEMVHGEMGSGVDKRICEHGTGMGPACRGAFA